MASKLPSPLLLTMTTTVTVLMLALSMHRVHCAHHKAAAAAPSPAASSGVDCTSLVMNMADCLSFVSAGSTMSKPEGSCCTGLKSVLKTDAECLCEAFKSSASLGVALNVTKAMTLPSICKVSAPSAANCALSLSPAGAPSAGDDASSPTVSNTVGGGANDQAQAPALAPGSSSSYALSVSVSSMLMGLFVVASFSSF